MEQGAAVAHDLEMMDELQCFVIVNALGGPGLRALTWVEDEVVLIQLFRCQVIQFL